ncbi:hypothetical protein BH24ACI3_BH24ACI3_08430 [soil metagenome]
MRRSHEFRNGLTYIAPILIAMCVAVSGFGQTQISQEGDQTLYIDDAPQMNVIAFGKTVVIRKHAKEVFSWGGDIIIEGRVDGDVAALGGSVIHRDGGFIGGTVIVIGGSYRPETGQPLRGENSETVVFGMFEDEFREMAKDPSTVLAPSLTPTFIVQRLLSVLFWFLVTLGFATLAPGAVSRATARVRLSLTKVSVVGAGALVLTAAMVIGSLQFLPDYLGAVVSLMVFVLLMLAFGFGRIVLQVSLGKAIQQSLIPASKRSESLAVLIGVVLLGIILSLPYVWLIAVFAVFAVGTGLILTARTREKLSIG